MTDKTGKILERKKLDNGMELILYDRSRITAGDRWQVDLQCETNIPIHESYWANIADEDPQLLADTRKMLGEELVFVINKKRNFIDDKERDTILQQMVEQVHENILEYLKRPDFPLQLFKKQYRDARQKVMIQKAMSRSEK